jgi:hypothetical protein
MKCPYELRNSYDYIRHASWAEAVKLVQQIMGWKLDYARGFVLDCKCGFVH